METRVLKVFTDEDIAKIQETVQSWKTGEGYEDVAGFCKSASLEEIEKNGFVLTPGRYVGADTDEFDEEEFLREISVPEWSVAAVDKWSLPNLDRQIEGTSWRISRVTEQISMVRLGDVLTLQ